MRRIVAAIVGVLVLVTTPSVAHADAMLSPVGGSFGPGDAWSLAETGFGLTEVDALTGSFTGADVASPYTIAGDAAMLLSDNAQLAFDASALAQKSLTDAEARRAAALRAGQGQVGPDGCPAAAPAGTLRNGADKIGIAELCARSVAQAPTPEAAVAIKYALAQLGDPYACGGVGRMDADRYDCSSLVMRAYAAAGLKTIRGGWAPTTYDMDDSPTLSFVVKINESDARPGDLVITRNPSAGNQHVVMLLADGFQVHTGACGDVANVTNFRGFRDVGPSLYVVTRRVDPAKAR
jgi:cell wall-associated NlpC family hydrolase